MNELLVVPEEHGIYHCQCPDHLNMFATLKCRMAVVVALKDTKCRRETYFSTLAVSHNIRIGVSAVPHKIPSITTAIDRNTQDFLGSLVVLLLLQSSIFEPADAVSRSGSSFADTGHALFVFYAR